MKSIRLIFLLSSFFLVCGLAHSCEQENKKNIENTKSVVVVSNVFGKVEKLREVLKFHSLIDEDENWVGNKRELVVLGEKVNSDASAKSLLLLQQLKVWQQQAESLESSVYIVLSEKELRWLLGDSAFESGGDDHWVNILAPGTELGDWLSSQNLIINLNGHLFADAGVEPQMSSYTVTDLEQRLKRNLDDFRNLWRELVEQYHSNTEAEPLDDASILNLRNNRLSEELNKYFKELVDSKISPSYYLGNSFCHPLFEQDRFEQVLKKWNANYLWTGRSMYKAESIEQRFDSQLYILDSLQSENVNSELWNVVLEQDSIKIFHGTEEYIQPILPSPDRHIYRPYGLTERQIVEFLETGKVISRNETKEGKTKPLKVRLKKGDKELKAIFKMVNESKRERSNNIPRSGDRYANELAAYHFAKLLGIDLIPVTTQRVIRGKRGAIQLWIDGLVSAIPLNRKTEVYSGMCDPLAQESMMDVFDYLIMNHDRNQSNIVFTRSDWQIWFIDHTRAFGTGTRLPPYLKGANLKLTKKYRERINSLSKRDLKFLTEWISERQVEAIWKRREKLLKEDI
ncbi:hypothetical protein [Aliikangiella sp. G2MR2-5]|uniref:hypothetical protein n=1 Tax=Aliikangiella sp. G2MR2-5 TaxID=2788943 RepID=UPI0018A96B5A|nr:hypothetical protein [Aliikangiella sp. G2MR2-5]